jgi:thiol-disulfide isomerase/thioredoxin
MNRNLRLGFLIALISSALCSAATPTLKEGDKAPALQVGKWIQGEPVADFGKGKAYIVEFWATWCGPCRASIPHLNELHLKFKDKGLVVIGQDCWEEDDSAALPFVKKMGQKMTYRVALDSKEPKDGKAPKDAKESRDGKMTKTWMEAAGAQGIPTAFLIDRTGTVAWIGHPMQLKDTVLQAILDDRYDIKKEAALKVEVEALTTEFYKKLEAKELDGAATALRQLESKADEFTLGWMNLALFSAKRDFNGAFAVLEKQYPKSTPEVISESTSEAFNYFAWSIASDTNATPADLALALKAADRGVAASGGEGADVLDSQARILFRLGKREEAIRIQEKALKFSTGKQKELLEKTLASYRKGELPKE